MMAELVARGPIACTVAVTEEFEAYTSGVFNDTTGAKVSTYYYTYHTCTYSALMRLYSLLSKLNL